MADRNSILAFLTAQADDDLVPWACQLEAMRRFDLSCRDVERLILQAGLLPKRYQRNRRMISTGQQQQLFLSSVAVIGCGGLGGYVLEELARIGIGTLSAIDPDTFTEHNLNRQLLSSPSTLGTSKAEAAARRIAEVNPAVEVRPVCVPLTSDSARQLIGDAALVVDALDSVEARLTLAAACTSAGIPLVSGMIAGWFGYVTTVFPGERTLERLYSCWSGGKGIEAELGNPAFTPAVIASLQVAEAVKVLLGMGTSLRNRVLCVNLLEMETESVPMGDESTVDSSS